MKRKIVSIILILSLVLPFCCACTKTETTKKKSKKDKKETTESIEDEEEPDDSDESETESSSETEEETTTTASVLSAVRSDISSALLYHPELEDAVRHGKLHDVSFVDKSVNAPFTFTFDSYLADELSFCFFTKLEGNIPQDDVIMLYNAILTDADSKEEIPCFVDYPYYSESGQLVFGQIYWERPCSNFDLDVDLLWQDMDYNTQVISTYHLEFRDVDITPAKVLSIDKDVSVSGNNIHIRELLIGETGTLLSYDDPGNVDLFTLYALVTGSDGAVIADVDAYSIFDLSFFDDDGNRIFYNTMNSIYYSEEEDLDVVIESFYGAFSEGSYIKIDPQAGTAEYLGQSISIHVLGKNASYSDFGLPANDYMDSLDSYIFLVPSDGLPEFNSTYDIHLHTFSYNGEDYPHITKDGQDYIAIQIPDYFADLEDGCFYFVQGTDSEETILDAHFPLKMSDAT